MEFTTTEKGNRKLIHGGYMYVFQENLASDITSWECEKRISGECKAKIKLDKAGNFLERINNDTHAPSETTCEISANREDDPEVLLQHQRSYANKQQFLIFDSGQGDADRIFIFGTNQSLQLL